jgi:hypothetical protein
MVSATEHESLLRTHGLAHESTTVILSSEMSILYASPDAQDILRELKGSILRPETTVPPSILAYIGQGIMKQIQLQRAVGNFAPVLNECSISSAQRHYHCSTLGIPSKMAIHQAKIIVVLRQDRWTSVRLRPVRRSMMISQTLRSRFSRLQSKLLSEKSRVRL